MRAQRLNYGAITEDGIVHPTEQAQHHSDDEDDCGRLLLLLFNCGILLFIYLQRMVL